MAYNHRMSMAGPQQHHNRGRKKDDDNDALMRLVSLIPELEDTPASKFNEPLADTVAARQRDRRMYQRYRHPIYRRRPGQAESPANPDGVRVVCRATHEYYARDCRASNACCSGGYMRRLPRHRP